MAILTRRTQYVISIADGQNVKETVETKWPYWSDAHRYVISITVGQNVKETLEKKWPYWLDAHGYVISITDSQNVKETLGKEGATHAKLCTFCQSTRYRSNKRRA